MGLITSLPHRDNRIRKKLVGVRRKGLTPREQEVALLAKRKLTNSEIARKLGIKRGTVKVLVHNILKKGELSRRPRRSSKGTKTAAGIERIRESQRHRWQLWRAARSADNT
jgi:DNA-binding CsgD family transcriptional regulator